MKPSGITISEYEVLKKRGYVYRGKGGDGKEIGEVIYIVRSPSKGLHESGYPFVRVFGTQYKKSKGKNVEIYDLSWHDAIHLYPNKGINFDALGKNIIRMWGSERTKTWSVSGPTWTSSLFCNEDGKWY